MVSQPSHAANLVTDHPMQWNWIEAVAEQEKWGFYERFIIKRFTYVRTYEYEGDASLPRMGSSWEFASMWSILSDDVSWEKKNK